MIRAWLARRTPGVHRAVDETVVIGASLDLADARIEGLRDALAEALQRLDEEKAARAREVAQLRYALAQAVQHAGLERYLQAGIDKARRAAEEPTVVTDAGQFRRAPAEPTHHVPQPAPGWRGAQTEQRRSW